MVYPSLPYQILDVVFPDRVETYYDGYDEIYVGSSKGGYIITVIPRRPREGAPGPITFISSHDPWSIGVLVSPLVAFRSRVLIWMTVWLLLIYNIVVIGTAILFTPPSITIHTRELGTINIPDPRWRPDPVIQAYFIILVGFLAAYYLFNLFRFTHPSIKTAALLTIGAVNGTYYTVPAPEPLTTVKITDFLRIVGYRFYNLSLDVVTILNGLVASLIKENTMLREQALAYDDAISRLTQIDTMLKRFTATEAITRLALAKPLLFLLLIIIPLFAGIIIGLMAGGGVTIEPAP